MENASDLGSALSSVLNLSLQADLDSKDIWKCYFWQGSQDGYSISVPGDRQACSYSLEGVQVPHNNEGKCSSKAALLQKPFNIC